MTVEKLENSPKGLSEGSPECDDEGFALGERESFALPRGDSIFARSLEDDEAFVPVG